MTEKLPDFKTLSKESGLKDETLRSRWGRGWRGDKLVSRLLTGSEGGRRARRNSVLNRLPEDFYKKRSI